MLTSTRPGPAGRVARLTVVALLAAGVAAGCGSDDGAQVRDLGTSVAGSGSGSGSGTGVGSGSGSGSGAATCKPVGTELEGQATQTVAVELKDYEFSPREVTVAAGVVTFEVTNNGTEDHELAFLPGGGVVPLTPEGVPDEDALEQAGAFELEAFAPGETCKATYDLAPGQYTMFCIVKTADGTTHYDKGMQGKLTVT